MPTNASQVSFLHLEDENGQKHAEFIDPLLRSPTEEVDLEQPPPTSQDDMVEQHPMLSHNFLRNRRSRILDRDAPFNQSRGRWRVRPISEDPQPAARGRGMWTHLWNDWFHTLAYQRTGVLMMILFVIYTSFVFLFAFVYLSVSLLGQRETINPDGTTQKQLFCDMDIHNHMEAIYFSLSTMTSIGYGVSDYYFGRCWTPLVLVLAQVCTAILFDAVAIGLLFHRLSRGHKRAKTIMFSSDAIVRRVQGVPWLFFRVAELRRHQLLEATVRAYCIRHERHSVGGRIETTHYATKPMTLQHELSASPHILMSLPQVVAHRIDSNSPLALPNRVWFNGQGQATERPAESQRNEQDEMYRQEQQEMEDFWEDREMEIVVLLEGTDELTGAGIQTRHSYTYQDIMWNRGFVPCVLPYERNGSESPFWSRRTAPACVVDFCKFHETVTVPINSETCPHVCE